MNSNWRGSTHLFLLTFEIFNYSVHNLLVYSDASTIIMPLSICKKLNIQLERTNAKIIQLDRFQVPVVGELKKVIIRLSSNSRVHQCIDTVVVDIP